MKKSLGPVIGIALAVAIACTGLFYVLVANRLTPGAEASSRRLVLLAARDVARGSRLGTADVKAAEWVESEMPAGVLTAATKVDRLTAIQDIEAGRVLTQDHVASERGGGLGIPKGMRAISVQVHDSSGVLGLLRPGHRVDVQAVYVRAPLDGSLRTVLENIEVLKISTPDPAAGKQLPVVTLLVTPGEAEVAGLADAIARVRLVLRNPLDNEKALASVTPRPSTPIAFVPRPAAVSAPPVSGVLTLAPENKQAGCEKPEAK